MSGKVDVCYFPIPPRTLVYLRVLKKPFIQSFFFHSRYSASKSIMKAPKRIKNVLDLVLFLYVVRCAIW